MQNEPSYEILSVAQKKLLPKEELMKISNKKIQLRIGVLSTIDENEGRVSLTPQGVEILVNNGHCVLVESGAGSKSGFSDHNYSESGAEICESKGEVCRADIIMKMGPVHEKETDLFRCDQLILSSLYTQPQNRAVIQKLMKKRVTCIAFEYLQNAKGNYPVIDALSELGGCVSVNVASHYLSRSSGGRGVFLGGVAGLSPAEVVVFGSGIAAEFAAKTAIGLGANVKLFDDSIASLRDIQERLGQRIYTSIYHHRAVRKAFFTADAVIGAIPAGRRLGIEIPDDMVQEMKEGSVIVDLNIIQGGLFETSKYTYIDNPVYKKHGVIHYCVPNITAHVARTASIAVSNALTSIVLEISASSSVTSHIHQSSGFCEGIYIYKGVLTNEELGERLMLPYKNIHLLLAAF